MVHTDILSCRRMAIVTGHQVSLVLYGPSRRTASFGGNHESSCSRHLAHGTRYVVINFGSSKRRFVLGSIHTTHVSRGISEFTLFNEHRVVGETDRMSCTALLVVGTTAADTFCNNMCSWNTDAPCGNKVNTWKTNQCPGFFYLALFQRHMI